MEKFNNFVDKFVSDVFLAIILCCSFSYAFISSLGLNISVWYTLKISFIAIILIYFVFYNIVTVLSSISITAGGAIIWLAFFEGKSYVINKFFEYQVYCDRLLNYFSGDGNIDDFSKKLSNLLIIAVAIIVLVIAVKLRSFSLVILVGGLLFGVQWILGMFVSYTSLNFYIFSIIVFYIKSIYSKKKQSIQYGVTSNTILTVKIIPVALIIAFIVYKLPYSQEPIKWPWMDNKVNQFSNFVIDKYDSFSSEYQVFSVGKSGFGGDDRLGGSIKADNTEALEVIGPVAAYLKAVGKDTYTGTSWKDTKKEKTELFTDNSFINVENVEQNLGPRFVAALFGLPIQEVQQSYEYKVKFLDLKTKSVFLPTGATGITYSSKEDKIYDNFNGSYSFEKAQTTGFSYTVQGVMPKLRHEFAQALYLDNFYESIQKNYNTRSLLQRTFDSTLNDLNVSGRYVSIESLKMRAKNIKEVYTVLPETVPQRVKDLASTIAAGSKSNYEKAKKIETYLSKSYQYNLEVGQTPKNNDFVDYFLFEQKQGYCVHFASAMAVMGRSVGLPVRYVEGFKMPQKDADSDKYTVTNKNAHAWVEVYFEGFGWIAFEPTAAFTDEFYSASDKTPENTNSDQNTPMPENEPNVPNTDRGEIEKDELNIDEEAINDSRLSKGAKVGISIILVLLLIPTWLLIGFTIRKYKHNKMVNQTTKEAIVEYYQILLRMFMIMGYGIKDKETVRQYGRRIDGMFYMSSSKSFLQLSKDFEEARYSNNELSRDKLLDFDKAYKELLNIFIKETSKIRYFIYHYLLLKF